jgi:type III secretion YscU/HrpY family protein
MKEKTEKPTRKRLRDERKKGQVAKSKEIATCATLVVLFGYLWLFSKHFLSRIGQMMISSNTLYGSNFSYAYIECVKIVVKELIVLSIPFAICAMVITVLSYMLQFGVIFAAEPITPDFNRINPVEGFKRIFSWKSLFELIKTILKISLIGSIIYLIIKSNIQLLVGIPFLGIKTIVPIIFTIFGKLMLYVSWVFIFFAIIDYFFENKLFIHRMKMSIDEIRQEYKEREGDPQIKKERRRIQREYIDIDDLASRIEKSTFIIADSNKIAIAILYVHGETKLPIINAKGKYLLAERIIEIGRKFNITIVHDAAFAKKLFEIGRENSYIHGELIQPMANLLWPFIKR